MAEEHVEDHQHALNHTTAEESVGDRVTKDLLSFYTVLPGNVLAPYSITDIYFTGTMHIDALSRRARDCTEEKKIFNSIKQAGQQPRPQPVQGQVQNAGNSASMQATTASVNAAMDAAKNQPLAIAELGSSQKLSSWSSIHTSIIRRTRPLWRRNKDGNLSDDISLDCIKSMHSTNNPATVPNMQKLQY
ncbi:hypothetical protein PG984_016227 [Apiospora sp. TS-2023a]